MSDRLQCLLNAEAARIGFLPGRGRIVLRPVRKLAGAKATHAVDLVPADFEGLCRGDEDQCRIGGAKCLGETVINPALRGLAIMWRQINEAVARADMKRRQMLADRLNRVGDLMLVALLEFSEEVVAHGR